ncbi:MAG TPA: hypothetical protein VMW83_16410 [Spirochaetia bacterium]|nr:hypothetical protein [Spirochaetia bacterium]
MPDSFQIILISPPGYIHAEAFSEIAETLVCGLRGIGYQVTREKNHVIPGVKSILLGTHLLTADQMVLVPTGAIIYNLEQVDPALPVWTSCYVDFLRRMEVWDYSRRNIERLAGLGVAGRVKHVPIGYVPELARISPEAVEDIDVLFYGSLNDRRTRVIKELTDLGLNVMALFGVYGDRRDALISRAKVVLNLHYYEARIFEIVRISYLLANQKAVISECDPGTEIEEDMVDAVKLVPYEELATACRKLVTNEEERRSLALRGFHRIAARDEGRILQTVLGEG